MSEVILETYDVPIYIKGLDIIKGRKLLNFGSMLLFVFFPEIHLANNGIYMRKVVKLLNTKNGKTRIVRECVLSQSNKKKSGAESEDKA